jgi:chemotaxis response regulator CheB
MPVIMCSSLTQRGAKVTIEALASGARTMSPSPPVSLARSSHAGAGAGS